MKVSSIPIPITSREEGNDSQPLRELILRTSYGKSDRLDVPIFRSEKNNLTIPTREHVARGFCPHKHPESPAARSLTLPLLALSQAMNTDVRYEPLNNTPIHRSYPSPRGLFPVDVYLGFSEAERRITLPYNSAHHSLLQTPTPFSEEKLSQGSLQIQLRSSFDRIAPLYGDLTLSLCSFELGHLAYQVCVALNILNIDYECWVTAACREKQHAKSSCNVVPGIDITLGAQLYVVPSESEYADVIRIPVKHPNEAGLRQVNRQYRWMTSLPESPRRLYPADRSCTLPLRIGPNGCYRSSGNFINGMFGTQARDDELDNLIGRLLRTFRLYSTRQSFRPHLTLLRTHTNFDVTVIKEGDTRRQNIVGGGCAPLSYAYGGPYSLDIDTIQLVIAFSVDCSAFLSGESSHQYIEMLIATGVLAQGIANDAAEHGFMARPFKGMKEDVIEAAFDLPGQCIYTILLGKASQFNPALSLSSLDVWAERRGRG